MRLHAVIRIAVVKCVWKIVIADVAINKGKKIDKRPSVHGRSFLSFNKYPPSPLN